jgi:hypothetical protein
MHRKITRQSRWNLRRGSDRAIPNQAPGMVGEGVETGWRASQVDEVQSDSHRKVSQIAYPKGRRFKSAPRNHEVFSDFSVPRNHPN